MNLGLKAVPAPASCTSLLQQWHKPRVRGIKPESILKVMVKDPCKAAQGELNRKLKNDQETPGSRSSEPQGQEAGGSLNSV